MGRAIWRVTGRFNLLLEHLNSFFIYSLNALRSFTFLQPRKKNWADSEKVWKMGQKCFLFIKFNKELLCGLSDVLPHFVSSMALIGMELLGTLELLITKSTTTHVFDHNF